MDSSWNLVTRKKSKKLSSNVNVNLSLSDVVQGLDAISSQYDPYSTVLYGSYSRRTNTINSDIDVLFIWKKLPESSHDIKRKIEIEFGKKVDMVNMIYKGKLIDNEEDDEFLTNVYEDGIVVHGHKQKDLIKLSMMIGKVK